MFLSGFQIVNFRNFKCASFCFSNGANTVIGENDSGKSNALTAMRMLLDDSFLYNTKRLKESDFSYALPKWKGHWIIISATFDGLTDIEKKNDVCASLMVDDKENADAVSSFISTTDRNQGVITLFIRPQKSIRKRLFDASGDEEAFNNIRDIIRLSDYEFYFTSKSKIDFTQHDIYKKIVGNIDLYEASNPENDDSSLLGCRLNITDIQAHISLVYIDALRDVLRELRLPRNPVRRIIEAVEGNIDPRNTSLVKDKIRDLNEAIMKITEISDIGTGLNGKLVDILGVVYSPELSLSSELSDELTSLSRFIAMKPKNENNIELLGLGHLNMIYLALKIVEFEACRSRELLNIIIIEEPEAHIHSHTNSL